MPTLHLKSFDPEELFKTFDCSNSGTLTTQELRDGFVDHFQMHLTTANIRLFSGSKNNIISDEQFIHGLEEAFSF
jgi:hypothetical protein